VGRENDRAAACEPPPALYRIKEMESPDD
jgi:hypothetical protein